MDVVELIQQNMLVAFVGAFFLFHTLVIQKDYTKVFFVLAIATVAYLVYKDTSKQAQAKVSTIGAFIDKIERQLKNFTIDNNFVYLVHKPPKTIAYIRKNEAMKQLLYDMQVVLHYDQGSFLTMVIYLDYFLRYHYMVMMEKYSYTTYKSVMQDLRNEILNISKSFVHSVPKESKWVNQPDLDAYLQKKHTALSQLTYKYQHILRNKFGRSPTFSEPPYETMPKPTANDNYAMY